MSDEASTERDPILRGRAFTDILERLGSDAPALALEDAFAHIHESRRVSPLHVSSELLSLRLSLRFFEVFREVAFELATQLRASDDDDREKEMVSTVLDWSRSADGAR